MKLCGIIILFIAGLQLVICDDGELFRWTVMEYLSLPRAREYYYTYLLIFNIFNIQILQLHIKFAIMTIIYHKILFPLE